MKKLQHTIKAHNKKRQISKQKKSAQIIHLGLLI